MLTRDFEDKNTENPLLLNLAEILSTISRLPGCRFHLSIQSFVLSRCDNHNIISESKGVAGS